MTKQLDLEERLEAKRAAIEDIEDVQEELIEEIEEKYGSYGEAPETYDDKFDELEENRVELKGEVNALEDTLDGRDDTVFVMKQLSGGAVADIQDRVNEKSFDFDIETQTADGVPKAGYGEILWVRKSVVQSPDWVEDSPDYENDPANLPWKVFNVVSEAVNNYNTVGDADLGNSSLRERMESDS